MMKIHLHPGQSPSSKYCLPMSRTSNHSGLQRLSYVQYPMLGYLRRRPPWMPPKRTRQHDTGARNACTTVGCTLAYKNDQHTMYRTYLPWRGRTQHQGTVHLKPQICQQDLREQLTMLAAKNSPSVKPKKNRTARNPAVPLACSLLITQPCSVDTTPQTTPIRGSQILGPSFFRIRFQATSSEM